MQQTDDTVPVVPVCRHCGSANVMRDAWAVWNVEAQSWELGAAFDNSLCGDCEAEMKWFEWLDVSAYRTGVIRRLNDQLRQGTPGPYDQVVLTRGVAAFGDAFIVEVIARLRTFAAFDADNDPHQEHDFGTFGVEGEQLYFKIDYYNLAHDGHSSDPTDRMVTARMLTIMLASEY